MDEMPHVIEIGIFLKVSQLDIGATSVRKVEKIESSSRT